MSKYYNELKRIFRKCSTRNSNLQFDPHDKLIEEAFWDYYHTNYTVNIWFENKSYRTENVANQSVRLFDNNKLIIANYEKLQNKLEVISN